MAREFENLEILISVLNSKALENINRLIRSLEKLERVAMRVRTITITVDVNDSQLQKLRADMATLGDETVDVRSRQAGKASDIEKTAAGQRSEMIRHLSAISSKFSINNAQNTQMIMTMRSGGGGGMGRVDPQEIADVMMNAVLRTRMGGDPTARGRPDEVFEKQSIFNIKQRDINNALAKFLPLFTAFKLALPAAIAGIVGLAAAAAGAAIALGSIAGLAFLGLAAERAGGRPDIETFQDIFGDVVDMFLDAFLPLAMRIAPMASQALDGLGMLLEDIATVLHPILGMRGSAADFARFARRVIPDIISDLLTAFTVVEPLFRDIASALEGASIVEFFVKAFSQVEPQLRRVAGSVIELAPRIVSLSQGFLDVSTRILQLITFVSRMGERLGLTSRHAGRVVAVFGAMFTILAVINALATFRLIPALVGMSQALWTNIGAFLVQIGATKASTVANYIHATSTWVLVAATFALIVALSILTGGILALVGSLTTAAASTAVATDNLKDFNDEMGRVEGQGVADRRPEFAASKQAFDRANGGGTTVNTTINTTEDDSDVDTAVNNLAWRVKK